MSQSPNNPPHSGLYSQRFIVFLGILGMVALFSVLFHQVFKNNLLGSDFYTFWQAEKALFIDHINPYSDEITTNAQMGILGREANTDEDQLGYAYPIYGLFMTLPTAWMSYDWAFSCWFAFNFIILFSTMLFLFYQKPIYFPLIVILFYPFSFGMIMGNYSIIIACILGLSLFLTIHQTPSRSIQIMTGILCAWITIKPQFVYLLLLFLFLDAVKFRRWYFLGSFFVSFVLFVTVSWLLLPGWIFDWIHRVAAYAQYTQATLSIQAILQAIIPPVPGQILTWFLLGLAVLFSGIFMVRWWLDHFPDIWLIAWFGLITYSFHPHGLAYEQLTFYIPWIIWTALYQKKYPRKARLFWIIGLIYSWVAFLGGRFNLIMDKTPVILFGIFVIWLFNQDASTFISPWRIGSRNTNDPSNPIPIP